MLTLSANCVSLLGMEITMEAAQVTLARADTPPASGLKLVFSAPRAKDKGDTLARLAVVWGHDMGPFYGSKLTGFLIKASDHGAFVSMPSQHTRGGRYQFIQPVGTEDGQHLRRLEDAILGAYAAWAKHQADQNYNRLRRQLAENADAGAVKPAEPASA